MAINRVKSKADAKNLRLEVSVEANSPDIVITDPVRLQQVLTILLDNAIKFTESGKISVYVYASCGEASDQNELHFDISDTGIGIPRDRMEDIFKPFHQVDSSATRRHGGTGMGLAIARRIIELMGGRYTVAVSLNRGAVSM